MSSKRKHDDLDLELSVFEELRAKVQEAEKRKRKYYREWQKADKEYSQLFQQLTQMCDHNWEIDRTSFDPCMTCWECTKCGACR